ncbi:MAG: class II aldolase/adducin family protein [Bryobacter sp.]|jgi:ribulose-5-phosphate 4-epimerase/fuculose-1-phosphate aldolase|nr:class II aldolase/adducin family protein [Bryobacter sp.]
MKDPREVLVEAGASFFARGYAFGSTGNLSVRVGETIWITPTGRSLRDLRAEDLAGIDREGNRLDGNAPSKEYPFHLAAYRAAGERAGAIVHLHSSYSVALSCLEQITLPVMTPYFLMRVAPLAVVPYFRPGSTELATAIGEAAREHDSLLLRNHGLVCLGRTVEEAVDRTEELEETARLRFLLRGEAIRELTSREKEEIHEVFPRSK